MGEKRGTKGRVFMCTRYVRGCSCIMLRGKNNVTTKDPSAWNRLRLVLVFVAAAVLPPMSSLLI
jgi:hypothetical protein